MDPETRLRLKAMFWREFLLPLRLFFSLQNVKFFLIAGMITSVLLAKSVALFMAFAAAALLVSVHDALKEFRSGNYVAEYRKYKYGDFRKAIRDVKKARSESLNSLTNLNKDGADETTIKEAVV